MVIRNTCIETKYFAHKPDPDAIATRIRHPEVPLMSQNGRRIAVSPSVGPHFECNFSLFDMVFIFQIVMKGNVRHASLSRRR